jgi:SAM-dependent methyltransferase
MCFRGAVPGAYVHGYDRPEGDRLADQAGTLAEILHAGVVYPPGASVLEVGCAVGAQTVQLATRHPAARFTSIDISARSLAAARSVVERAGATDVAFLRADVFALPFAPASFDHVFVCFVLEHLTDPVGALRLLTRVVRPGGTITVIEGDHGSVYFHPDSAAAREVIGCQVELQRRAGGDARIGRRVYPMLVAAGLDRVRVTDRQVYVDASRPDLVEGFTRRTFVAMIEGVRSPAVEAGLVSAARFDEGLRDLRRTTAADGVFCYSFFRGEGVVADPPGAGVA